MNNQPLKVLIIEDEEDAVFLMLRVLRTSYPEVVHRMVSTREEVIEAFEDESWDIVTCDYQMPQLNPKDALDIVKARNEDIPFLLISGEVTDSNAIKLLKNGAHDYINKNRLQFLPSSIEREINEAQIRRDKKAADRQLRDSEERFRHFAEASSDWFWEINKNFRYTYLSEQYEILFGISGEALIGKLLNENDTNINVAPNIMKNHFEDLRAQQTIRNFEFPKINLNTGETIWASISAVPIFDENMVFTGYRGTGTNITERKNAEAGLLRNKNQLKTAAEMAKLGYWEWDELNSYALYYSPTLLDILDVDAAEFIDGKFDREKDLMLIHPDDREKYILISSFPNENDNTFDIEYRTIRRSGDITYCREYGQAIRDNTGKIVRSFGIIQDITNQRIADEALRKSEASLSHHIQNTPLGCISWDSNLYCTEWNNSAEKIFGYSADEAIGQHASEIVVPVELRDYVKNICQLLIEQKGGTRSTNENITKDGQTIICDWYNTLIVDENSEVIAVTSLIMDITERKKLEDQLRQAQRMEAVGQLTGGVAHDFNNLLAVMMGNLEFALDKINDNAPVCEFIEKALGAIDSGSALTQQLLSFSRQQTLSPSVQRTNELIVDTISMLSRTLGENIVINANFDDNMAFVYIDQPMFNNALLNLALNARDAMSGGGILSIATSVIQFDGEQVGIAQERLYGPYIMIFVTDTGVGIEKENLEKVMEPFFTTKEVGKGSGLGLSMVYGFIHQSNGHVGITSIKGEGTTVSLYLPIIEEGQEEDESEPSSYEAIIENKTLLLVEDNPEVRETTSTTLKLLGFEVIEAEDGPSAIDVLEKSSKRIDLVFSDVVMPNNMSGIELAERIKTDYKDIKVLLTSGYPDKIAENEILQKLNIKLLAKPYKRAQLVAAIENAMQLN